MDTERVRRAFDNFIYVLEIERAEAMKENEPKQHIAFALLEIEGWGRRVKCIERPVGMSSLKIGVMYEWYLDDSIRSVTPADVILITKAVHDFNVEHGTGDKTTKSAWADFLDMRYYANTGATSPKPLVRIIE